MPEPPPPARVLVSDFDGTIARDDFYQVFLRHARPSVADAVWDDYCAGRVTHFDALRLIFGSAAPGEDALVRLHPRDGPRPGPCRQREPAACRPGGSWSSCRPGAGGTSTGYSPAAGVEVELHANPGRVIDGRLVMERPRGHAVPVSEHRDRQGRRGAGEGRPAGRWWPSPGMATRTWRRRCASRRSCDSPAAYWSATCAAGASAFRPFDRWTEIVRAST